jgi:protein disulfide-isomerase
MKKILLILLVLSSLTINAQELTWHTDMAKASELSIKKNKPMLLVQTGADGVSVYKRKF